jgi:hypothetical protein
MIAFSVPSFLIHDIFAFIPGFHPPSVHPLRGFVVVVVSLQLLCTPAIPSFLLQGLLRSPRRSNRFAF